MPSMPEESFSKMCISKSVWTLSFCIWDFYTLSALHIPAVFLLFIFSWYPLAKLLCNSINGILNYPERPWNVEAREASGTMIKGSSVFRKLLPVREFCWCVSRLKYETLSCLPLWFHGHISLRQRYEGIGPAQSGSVNANLSFKHPAVSFIFIWFCILTGWCWFSLFRIRWSSWSWRKCLKCFYRVHTDLESSAQN